jgi:hypothetical protein
MGFYIGKEKASQPREGFIPNPNLKLAELVSEVMRFKRYSIRTETTYPEWIRRLASKTNAGQVLVSVVCALPAAIVNNTTLSIPTSYATRVRYSPGLHRASAGAAPAMHRADRGTHSRIANVVSRAMSEPCLRNWT